MGDGYASGREILLWGDKACSSFVAKMKHLHGWSVEVSEENSSKSILSHAWIGVLKVPNPPVN